MESLVQLGKYGSSTMILVGDTNLFKLVSVDLVTRHIHLHEWPADHKGSCNWQVPASFEAGAVLCVNGIVGNPRAHFTLPRLADYINDIGTRYYTQIIASTPSATGHIPILKGSISVIHGRPFLTHPTEMGGLVLKGRDFVEWKNQKRLNPLEFAEIDLSGNGFFMGPTVGQLRVILDREVGLLCDPYAPKDQLIRGMKSGPRHLMVPWKEM